jgi:hypothetical protein
MQTQRNAAANSEDGFELAVVDAMTVAFDKIRGRLADRPELQLYKVAGLLIAEARGGERDPERMYLAVCQNLGLDQ